MSDSNLSVFGVFSLLSVLAVGGGTAVLPEMKELVVNSHQWLNDDQFRDIYGLGQVAPGPNMLMVLVIGYHVSGYLGALLAFTGFFLPASLISLGASRVWDHFEGSPWRESLQKGLAPLVVGLMAAGAIAIARTAIEGAATIAMAIAVFLGVYFVKRVNPALFILAGGVIGFLALQ
ncbi:MAG: chromate transporter [Chelatococcus sp.]|jgi:chromate transporter|uniref:chromate transporter n=1 Tax=unclassified Chelatococcus TaxID=2638111 RepID=UPI001BCC6AF4|nr:MULTISPECIES: chromate transporter [unclassified Chelatococcus]CAH1671567.1 Chromate transport protein ChrA [Hyphomicrobiales bacterium]MBS7739061.1 chromate transporter [Chelatococcus sp. HY11]MBX3539311.1 chromate transporter [Chelatococcus sp.]MBX3543496.1 chromate transporter [Chelatococcus sp.]MCO5076409.1 chromate transporter [Chelatococcus sp.]